MAKLLRSICRWLCLGPCLLSLACTSTHGPSGSTETGNPPVIDLLRVALRVSADMVSITGEPGAVMPAGASVEITNLTTGAVTMTVASKDGSFMARVDGSANDAYTVRASAGGEMSKPVYVVRGGAMVSSGADSKLSCDQRTQLAKAQLELTAANADKSCSTDADCGTTLAVATCYHTCQGSIASQAGLSEIDAAKTAIDAGLCASFADDGCSSLVTACPMMVQRITCSAGKCVGNNSGNAGNATCEERRQEALDALSRAAATVNQACMVDADCELAAHALSCVEGCGLGYSAIAMSAEAEFVAARNAVSDQYCESITQNGCARIGQPPCPPGPPMRAVCTAGTCSPQGLTTTLTCQARDQDAAMQLTAAGEMADRTCSADSDCIQVPVKLSCHDTCGYYQTLSQKGKASLESTAEEIEAGVCSDFQEAGCQFNALPCLPALPGKAKCNAGQCFDLRCGECIEQTIRWGESNGMGSFSDESSLETCVHYQHRRWDNDAMPLMSVTASCETNLIGCTTLDSPVAVRAAIANSDVQQALLVGPSMYGIDSSATNHRMMQIQVDGQVLRVGPGCGPGATNCTPIPSGVATLVQLLRQVDQSQLQQPACSEFR